MFYRRFPFLQALFDQERRRDDKFGQFLFVRSASMELLQQSGESLAGRITYLELCGIDVLEFGAMSSERINQLWLRGGFPESRLERFWTMLAHNQSGIFNASLLGRSLEVSSVTVSRYLDLMVDLLLVRRLQPWTSNIGKRLVKSPKVYIRDSGVTHA